MSNASLIFLPWVRQGAAAAITVADSQLPTLAAVASVAATVTLNGVPVPGVAIKLRGPADVIGIDTNQVVRTDPQPATNDFEPNCFPSIEFDRPDFPWLFTPAKANDTHRLRPWLCLVVVKKQAGVTLASGIDSPSSTLTIDTPANPAVELPDLKDSWAWAHAQVAADDITGVFVTIAEDAGAEEIARAKDVLDTAFKGGPELTLSRLVCPRILAGDTDYIACVVPTFELGRRTALGIPVSDDDVNGIALAPAWVLVPAPLKVVLPVYYYWEFRTGPKGDFESLARALKASVPDGLGTRTIDISQPGFVASGATTAQLEGALLPIPPAPPPNSPPPAPAPDPIPLDFKKTLASIINEPSRVQAADPTADPLLAPPTYGRWHAGKAVADPTGTTWLDQLNLDPRWRVAAAFGTRVIQDHQDALMASAWEQAAELPTANQRMRQLQLSMAVGEVLHQRHFSVLSEEMVLRVTAPAFGRLRMPQTNSPSIGPSLLASQAGTLLPAAANRSAMRRIGRQRGPLTRRVAAKGFQRSPTDTWVARLNRMWTAPTPPPPTPPPPPQPPTPPTFDYVSMPSLALFLRLSDRPSDSPSDSPSTTSAFGAFFVAPENAPVTPPGVALVQSGTEAPDFFRSAAREHLNRVFVPSYRPITPHFIVYQPVKSLVLGQTDPRLALSTWVKAIISTGDRVLAPTAAGVTPIGVETVMAAPYFPQPMYEPLRDLSQELLLPGLDKVEPETVLGLRTNRRFVEAYMVGLNHEMGRELLWRGYPTDQRGTYFDRFWGQGVPNSAPKDITDLNTWSIQDPTSKKIRTLGDSQGAPPLAEEFVMLIRSNLLRRYPNAVIYLTPAIPPASGSTDPTAVVPDLDPKYELPPIFSGSFQPDVAFFGFPVTATAAVGGPNIGSGYYLVIQEHPTESRFGLDDGVGQALGASYLVIGPTPPAGINPDPGTWNTNAAQMARITRRLPVRMAIHASRLITPV